VKKPVSSRLHERISDLFLRACELDPDQRAAFLDEACANDPELRAEVESLLAHDNPSTLEFERIVVLAPPRHDGSASPEAVSTKTIGLPETLPSIPGYRILRLLGQGGMGTVLLAEDTTLGRRVAIKMIGEELAARADVVQRFLREARVMATVEHPNIVRVYAFEEIEGRYYLIMECVEGESLADRIRSRGKLDVQESLRILAETVDALETAWERGIVHRDVKPGNVLLDSRGHIRVADFGLAKGVAQPDDPTITQTGQGIGTPQYISPEQARGKSDLDFRADVYSLGIVLYEMLVGLPPFRGSVVSVLDQHLHTPLPSLRSDRPEIGREVEQLCEWMTRKQTEDRPQSYAELRHAIKALAEEAPSVVTSPGSLPSFLIGEAEPAPAFVGRERELERLSTSLDRAMGGEGQVLFVTGEAGSGKTALIDEFMRRAQKSHPDLVVTRGNCDAQTGVGDPYLPFREVLSLLTGDVEARRRSGAITHDHARRLWSLVPLATQAVLEEGPDLLGTFVSGSALVARARSFTPSPAGWRVRLEEAVARQSAAPRDAGLQQTYLFEQYGRALRRLARHHPLFVALEDLHWADGGSCSLLFHLGRSIAGSRILVVGSYRPAEVELDRQGERHPMGPVIGELQRQFGDFEIKVGEEQTREFVDALVDQEANRLGTEFREALYRQTRGHPLFTVELLGSMRDRGMVVRDRDERWVEGSALDWGTLPARVEGAISERIDRLRGDLQELLSLASVQGEEFTAEVLAEMKGTDSREIVRSLSRELGKRHRLVSARGIRRIDGRRVSTYRFQHILFQKYLYGQIDEVERAYLHEEAGTALETLYAEHAEDVAVQLARHFQEAGITPKAIRYLRRAGDRAVRLSANEEAIANYTRALELVETLPYGDDAAREELALQLSLGPPLMGTAGPGSDELSRAYLRAWELCDEVGDARQRFQTLFLLVHHHANQGRLAKALELAEQLLEVVETAEGTLPAIMAYWARGFARLGLGRLADALADHDHVIGLYDSGAHSSLAYIFGMDPAASSLSMGAWALWCLGRLDQAQEYSRRALAHAKNLDHPSSTAHVLFQAVLLNVSRGDNETLQTQTAELVRVSREYGVSLFGAWGTVAEGWLLSEQGRHDEGIETIRRGLAAALAAGSQLGHGFALSLMARAQAKAGRVGEALAVLSETISMAEQDADDRTNMASYLHLKGEWLLYGGAGSEAEAETMFRRAIEVARDQGALSWELRATVGLSSLLRSGGRQKQARGLLSNVYGRFTEGLDTPELTQAKALLDELS
jgi:serine/threonine protein kinase/tetratricopeptide (TPR) repeat protein